MASDQAQSEPRFATHAALASRSEAQTVRQLRQPQHRDSALPSRCSRRRTSINPATRRAARGDCVCLLCRYPSMGADPARDQVPRADARPRAAAISFRRSPRDHRICNPLCPSRSVRTICRRGGGYGQTVENHGRIERHGLSSSGEPAGSDYDRFHRCEPSSPMRYASSFFSVLMRRLDRSVTAMLQRLGRSWDR